MSCCTWSSWPPTMISSVTPSPTLPATPVKTMRATPKCSIKAVAVVAATALLMPDSASITGGRWLSAPERAASVHQPLRVRQLLYQTVCSSGSALGMAVLMQNLGSCQGHKTPARPGPRPVSKKAAKPPRGL